MKKIKFENGELIEPAKLLEDNTISPALYEGNTPLDCDNLNLLQDNIEEAINNISISESGGSGLFVGAIIAHARPDTPYGWLRCDGSTFSVTDYPELAKFIPEGVLPTIKSRTIVGFDEDDKNFNEIGKTGGNKTHRHVDSTGYRSVSGTNYVGNTNDNGYITESTTSFFGSTVTNTANTNAGNVTRYYTRYESSLQPYIVFPFIIKAKPDAYTESLTNLDEKLEKLDEKLKDLDDTGWIDLSYATGFTAGTAQQLQYRAKNGFVTIRGGATGTFTAGTYATVNSELLPEKYRPENLTVGGASGYGGRTGGMIITTTGHIQFNFSSIFPAPTWMSGCVTYPIED